MQYVVSGEAGDALGGDFEVVMKIRSEMTGGALAVLQETVPPRRLITPHTRHNDVSVYVLSEQIGVVIGDSARSAGAGSWVFKPRNVIHAMWNPTDQPARKVKLTVY